MKLQVHLHHRLEQLLPPEAQVVEHGSELLIRQRSQVFPVFLLQRILTFLVVHDEIRRMVWHEVYAETHISISVASAQHKASDIGQLIQSSARASSNLALQLTGLLPLETLRHHKLMDLITAIAPQI